MNSFIRAAGSILVFAFGITALAGAAGAQKLTLQDVVSKHRDSIGTKEKLASIKDRLVTGTSEFESKLPSKKTGGKAVIASRGQDFMFLVSLNSGEYPFEKIGFFANRINLPWVTAGTRSPLGAFIAEHERMLSDGLFTGAISGSWALLDPELRGAQTNLSGRKKLDEGEAYVIEYFPKGVYSPEFTIRIFIHTETFRHIRTEYMHVIHPTQDTFGRLGRQSGVRQTLTEFFSDFQTVDGMTLPYSYRAAYSTESNSGTYEYFWGVKVQQYHLNPNLGPNFFTFEKRTV